MGIIPLNPTPTNNKLMSSVYNTKRTYLDVIREKKEEELYKAAKAKREAEMLPKAKLKEDDENTYKNLVLTKWKEYSPIALALTGPVGITSVIAKKTINSDVGKKVIPEVGKVINAISEKGGEIIKTQALYSQTASETLGTSAAGLFNGGKQVLKEVLSKNNYKEKEKNIINIVGKQIEKTSKDIELDNYKRKISYGMSGIKDIVNFHSAEEKRRQIIQSAPVEIKKELDDYYKKTNISQMVIDTTSGIAAGLLTGSALGKLGTKVAITSPKLGKLISTSGDIIDKGLIGGSQITGGLMAIQAATHYLETGDYIFDDDQEATEAMFGGLLATGLKVGGKGLVAGGKYAKEKAKTLKDLYNNPDIRKGFTKVMNGIKDGLAEGADDISKKLIPGIVEEGKGIGTTKTSLLRTNYDDETVKRAINNNINDFKEKSSGVMISSGPGYSEIMRLFPKADIKGKGYTTNELFVELNRNAKRIDSDNIKATAINKEAVQYYEKLAKDGLIDDFLMKKSNKGDWYYFTGKISEKGKQITKSKLDDVYNDIVSNYKDTTNNITENITSGITKEGKYIKNDIIQNLDNKVKEDEILDIKNKLDVIEKKGNFFQEKYKAKLNKINEEGLLQGEEDGLGKILKYDMYKLSSIFSNESHNQFLKELKQKGNAGDLANLNAYKVNGRIKNVINGLKQSVDNLNEEQVNKLNNLLTIKNRLTQTELKDISANEEIIKGIEDKISKLEKRKIEYLKTKSRGIKTENTFVDKNTEITNQYNEAARKRFEKGDFTYSELQKGYKKLNSLYEGKKLELQDGTKYEIVEKPSYGNIKLKDSEGNIIIKKAKEILNTQKQVTVDEVKNYLKGTEYKGFKLVPKKETSEVVNNIVDNISIEDDYIKIINEKIAGLTEQLKNPPKVENTLGTSIKGINLNKEQMSNLVNQYEGEDLDVTNAAKNIVELGGYIRDELLDSGTITKDLYDKLSKNPYYVPTKLSEEDIAKEGENLFDNIAGSALVKRLKDGLQEGDERTFGTEALDNLKNYYFQALNTAKRNRYINDVADILEEGGRDIVLRDGKLPGIGNVRVKAIRNGEEVEIAIPKYIADNIKNPYFANNIVTKANSFFKMGTTGIGNPLFSLKQASDEAINGLLHTIADDGDVLSYLTTLPKHTIAKVAEKMGYKGKLVQDEKLLSDYISAMSADFGFYKSHQGELKAENILYKTPMQKKIGNTVDTMHYLSGLADKWASRGPAFVGRLFQDMKDKGLKRDDLFNILKNNQAGGKPNLVKINKELEKLGINPEIAADFSRGIFDYTDSSNILKTIGNYVPYFQIPLVGLKATGRLLKRNPKKVAGILGGLQAMAYGQYAYNYGLPPFDTDENKARGELLRSQEGRIKFQPGMAHIGEDGKVYFSNIGLKNQLIYDTIYANTVLIGETLRSNNDFKGYSEKLSQSILGMDFSQGVARGVINKLTPPYIKQAIETTLNKSFYTGQDIYKKGVGVEDISEGTSKFAIVLAKAINDYTGGSLNEKGVREGGIEISPKLIDHINKSVTPKGIQQLINTLTGDDKKKIEEVNKELDKFIKSKGVEKYNMPNYLQSLFSTSFKILNNNKNNLYDIKAKQSEEKSKFNQTVKNNMKNMSNSELKEYIKSVYPNLDDTEREFLNNELKERIYNEMGLGDINTLKNFTADNIGEYALQITRDGGSGKEYIKSLQGKVSNDKLTDIIKYYIENYDKE